jgi:hypothetical protein
VDAIYAALGIEYLAIDVDGACGSTFFDLNTFAAPAAWCSAFDFVNNEGTIEHLANPINGFHVAHDIAKVGAVIRHNFPLVGWVASCCAPSISRTGNYHEHRERRPFLGPDFTEVRQERDFGPGRI